MTDRLNLGCGHDVRPGYVNLDIAPLPGVDVVHDLDDLPLPFPDASLQEVVCKDVLEHVRFVPLLRDIHRILAPGGRVLIEAPHFTSRAVFLDPTHRTAFTVGTFDFFTREAAPDDRGYYFDFHFSAVASRHIVFHRYRWQPWNYALEALVNRTRGAQEYYEDTGLSRIFPAANVRVALVR